MDTYEFLCDSEFSWRKRGVLWMNILAELQVFEKIEGSNSNSDKSRLFTIFVVVYPAGPFHPINSML